jgi:peptidoglycan/LPS O-acetylase OafA/YrhL
LRLAGLDAIRFVCALWVVFFHAGFVPFAAGFDKTSFAGKAIHAVQSNLFYGSAAVIVFFVISGFCIHYPYRERPETNWPAYFTRRYVRILIPMIAAYWIARFLGVGDREEGVMWTLRCELVYYTLYPLTLPAARRYGWTALVIATTGIWAALAIAQEVFGVKLAEDVYRCFAGLPCWLLGAKLAQGFGSFPVVSRANLWMWRGGIWGLSSLVSFLHFHSPLHSDATLTLLAFPVYFWLGRELAHFRAGGRVWPALAWGGLWSYSSYVIHVPAMRLYEKLNVVGINATVDWAMRVAFILVLSYLFYLAIEKPGHQLARRGARVFGQAPGRVSAQQARVAAPRWGD